MSKCYLRVNSGRVGKKCESENERIEVMGNRAMGFSIYITMVFKRRSDSNCPINDDHDRIHDIDEVIAR